MKLFLRLFVFCLLLLAIVLLVNTFRLSSRQSAPEAMAAKAVLVSDSAVARFAAALRLRTVSYIDYSLTDTTQFDQFLAFVRRSFPLVQARLTLEHVNQYGLLYTWKGTNPALKPVVLMGHYDVVPVIQGTERAWKRPPFGGMIDSGFVYGRGTLDDKSTVMGLLEATETLLRGGFHPERTLFLAFGQDEETLGTRGGKAIADLLASRKIAPEFVMDEGGAVKTDFPGLTAPVALIGISEKGYLSLDLTARAKGGHSSMPPPETSVGMVAEAIANLQKSPFPMKIDGGVARLFDYLGPEMSFGQRLIFANRWLFGPLVQQQLAKTNSGRAMLQTTIAPTIFRAGVKDNVLPIDATATVNFRILPGETIESVTNYVKATIANDQIEINRTSKNASDPSPISDPESPAFQTVAQTIKAVFPDAIVAPYLVLGGTDARFYARFCPNVYRFMPVRVTDQDTQTMHGTGERIRVKDYLTMVQFYAQLIQNSAVVSNR